MDQARIRARLQAVGGAEAELSADDARDVAFHLTDWLDDLAAFLSFVRSPDDMSARKVNDMLIRFLVHVPNHLAAAAKLYAGAPVSDIFGVGAVSAEPAGAGRGTD